jgi:hypothetical protein
MSPSLLTPEVQAGLSGFMSSRPTYLSSSRRDGGDQELRPHAAGTILAQSRRDSIYRGAMAYCIVSV